MSCQWANAFREVCRFIRPRQILSFRRRCAALPTSCFHSCTALNFSLLLMVAWHTFTSFCLCPRYSTEYFQMRKTSTFRPASFPARNRATRRFDTLAVVSTPRQPP